MLQQVAIPVGQRGLWEVQQFTVSEDEAKFQNMRAAFSFTDRGQYIRPGTYTRLMRSGKVIMSDTPSEMNDHSYFVRKAKGYVLINGLGLGMVLKNVLAKPEVETVIVNELSQDVIGLVAPHYQDDRLCVNHADALMWKPPRGIVFNAIWHDIWDDKCESNLQEMSKLHRRYARWLAPGGYQASWGREEIKRWSRRF